MRWHDLYIGGTGAALGDEMTTDAAVAAGLCDAAWAEHSQQLAVTIAPPGYPAPDYAVSAARQALADAGHTPRDVGPVVYCYVLHPGVTAHNPATYVQRALGIPGGPHPIAAVSDGCHGEINALASACAYLTVDIGAPSALVTAADVWPATVFDRWSPGHDAPFGDGGSALLVTRRGGRYQILSTATHNHPDFEGLFRGHDAWGPGRVHAGAPLDLMGRIHAYVSDAPDVDIYKEIAPTMSLAVSQALDDASVTRAEITRFVPQFCRMGVMTSRYLPVLGFDERQVVATVERGRRVGHTGAPDAGIALTGLDVHAGDNVLVYADGGGLSASAAVLRVI